MYKKMLERKKKIERKLGFVDMEIDNINRTMYQYELSDETWQNSDYKKLHSQYQKELDKQRLLLDKLDLIKTQMARAGFDNLEEE